VIEEVIAAARAHAVALSVTAEVEAETAGISLEEIRDGVERAPRVEVAVNEEHHGSVAAVVPQAESKAVRVDAARSGIAHPLFYPLGR
jgi:hypothetical protein